MEKSSTCGVGIEAGRMDSCATSSASGLLVRSRRR